MPAVPLTILNGFLGAGKTTLLRKLLVQSHRQGLAVSVVVNEMSTLDVDGVLVTDTEVVGEDDGHQDFVSIPADSISSPTGIAKLDRALDTLLRGRQPDLILLETSGSSHPLPLVKFLRDDPRIELHGVLALVDAAMLDQDYDAGQSLIPRLQDNLQQGRRGVENLLAEQIMFCSHLLLSRTDRLPGARVAEIAQAIHPLNPYVPILAAPWGRLALSEVQAMPRYDFHRITQLLDELQDVVEAPADTSQRAAYNITSQVIEDERPFHPQRLWEACHRHLGEGIHRSKGFFWLPGRADISLLWNQSAGSINLEQVGYWRAGFLERANQPLTAEEREVLQQQVARVGGRFGDRRCQLTVIGQSEQVAPFADALEHCLLTEEEIQWWQSGGEFDDPWPQSIATMTAD